MTYFVKGKKIIKDYVGPYMGTFRSGPYHVDSLSDDHIINQLWRWYNKKENENGLDNSDLIKAYQLIREYKIIGQAFGIVEISNHKDHLINGHFIGYDLSFLNYQSMLSWGLIFNKKSESERKDGYFNLFKLIEIYFQSKLNSYGLFEDYETALFFWKVTLEINKIKPNSFEWYLNEFQVVAVGLLPEEIAGE